LGSGLAVRIFIFHASKTNGRGFCPRPIKPWAASSRQVWAPREASQRLRAPSLSPLRRPANNPSTPICSSKSGHSMA
jgi:hypothetical protein